MMLLYSEAGHSRLDDIAGPGLLCAFDFDGTLAPIVSQPDQAHLPAQIRQHLVDLQEVAPVAIITGRAVDDIHRRLGFDPDFIIGNHGMEGVPGREADAERHHAQCGAWRTRLAAQLPRIDPGIELEDKRYSLSVHYRRAQDPHAAAARLPELFAALTPAPRVVAGKYVFNLMPQDAAHKGTALAHLMTMTGARCALYAGDDVTDEDVFRLARPDILTIRVEHAPHSAADFFVPHLRDVAELLADLVARLRAAGAANWVQTEAANTA